ncbi:ABC transporter permease [Streptomyces sp. NBC_01481]|uniref:ABC transporter permease n=1 Tax=Streptomyces sp. NBC_01481 TaxID=2975869 RepID=UPI00225541A5|nr:ABC transporter permease [Streptomyces sp. NBC_01481]MCX4586071.1 ABC transporter permease [Streptomyces sp. NBC_01481]
MTHAASSTGRRPTAVDSGVPHLGHAIQAEWTKIRSVRALWLPLVAAVVLAVSFVTLSVATKNPMYSTGIQKALDTSNKSFLLTQLAVMATAACAITREYGANGIHTSLLAVPRRGRFFTAKLIVVVTLATITGLLMSAPSVAIVFGSLDIQGSITDTAVVRAVIGAALYTGVLALLSLAIGAIVRSTATSITLSIGLFSVLPTTLAMIQSDMIGKAAEFLPTNAGMKLLGVESGGAALGPWTGFAVMCVWAAAATITAGFLLHKRDA